MQERVGLQYYGTCKNPHYTGHQYLSCSIYIPLLFVVCVCALFIIPCHLSLIPFPSFVDRFHDETCLPSPGRRRGRVPPEVSPTTVILSLPDPVELSRPALPAYLPTCHCTWCAMATLPRRKSGMGSAGGSTPRGPRHSSGGGGSTPGPSFRDHAPRTPAGAWGSGRMGERVSPTMPLSAGGGGNGVGGGRAGSGSPQGDRYRVACRDRWINVTKTMMGERAEIVTVNGCTYEGVIHVLTPVDPAPGGTRGLYQVGL